MIFSRWPARRRKPSRNRRLLPAPTPSGGGGRLLLPAEPLEVVPQILFVEGRLRTARPILLQIPEARGIRRHHLIDQDHIPIQQAELELRVSEDQPPLERALASEVVQRQTEPFECLRQVAASTVGQLGARDVLIMAGQCLGGRGEDRLWQAGGP